MALPGTMAFAITIRPFLTWRLDRACFFARLLIKLFCDRALHHAQAKPFVPRALQDGQYPFQVWRPRPASRAFCAAAVSHQQFADTAQRASPSTDRPFHVLA